MASPLRSGQRALEPLPSKSPLDKKRISRYPLPEEWIQDRAALKATDQGLPVLKVNKQGKLQCRRFAFSPDRRNIYVTTQKIKSFRGLIKAASGRDTTAKIIPLVAIERIQRGMHSKRFLQAQLVSVTAADYDEERGLSIITERDKELSLSIIYRSSDSLAVESLDLVVPDAEDFGILRTALKDLVALTREEKLCYTKNLQVLHYYWAELGKEWESRMTLAEWLRLNERLQVPLKKNALTNMFKEECSASKAADERLSFSHVALLVEDVKEMSVPMTDDPLEHIWIDMRKTDPVPSLGLQQDDQSVELSIRDAAEESVSAVALLSFIRSQQKAFSTTLEDVTELVRNLNMQITAEDAFNEHSGIEPTAYEDRLTKGRFFSFLLSDSNDIFNPDKGYAGSDDMTHPLSHYWINTSHDTYLAELPNSFNGQSAIAKYKAAGPDVPDAHMYTLALLRGVRCLELDVWDSPFKEFEPVVARRGGLSDSRTIPLVTILRGIRHFLDANPDTFPVILNIENHCSLPVQGKIAKHLFDTLGAANLLVVPPEGENLDDPIELPSPKVAKGKAILMAKRPRVIKRGCKVINDDYDDENDVWDGSDPAKRSSKVALDDYDKLEKENDRLGVIVGFDHTGPIRSKQPDTFARKPAEMLKAAEEAAEAATLAAKEAQKEAAELELEADVQEELAAQLTQQSGLSPNEVKLRAMKAAARDMSSDPSTVEGEEKSTKDEGMEVHEILTNAVEEGRDQYAKAAQGALEAANRVATCRALVKEAEESLRRAESDLKSSHNREKELSENARKAAMEARANHEYAEIAKERVEQVRQLLLNSEEHASSAGTVVQTALTEAKISEKRAAEAEARAERAMTAAKAERQRADEETRKEEELEQEVSDLHVQCTQATDEAKKARERVEKAARMLDRVNEQIKLIENSSQYRKEVSEKQEDDASSARLGGSFVSKHSAKLEERETCRALIKEASEENSSAELKRNHLQQLFEEKAQAWRVQADIAAKARKSADRSFHIAEEMAEHAEEEREAANLRHVARQRAEATVERQASQKDSISAQLREAERAATEARNTAYKSRKHADRLSAEAEKAKDHRTLEQAIEQQKWNLRQAKGDLEGAILEKEKRDKIMLDEKRRLDTNSEVYTSAVREVAAETSRIKIEQLYQQEAIVAYNKAKMVRKQAIHTAEKATKLAKDAENKQLALNYTRIYKEKMDEFSEISTDLARLTLLHTLKFTDWKMSAQLTGSHVHSFAQNVLLDLFDTDPVVQREQFRSFTKSHLCRVFSSWKYIHSKRYSNDDPVFAWSLGCQLVAANYQSVDESLLLVDGRFRQNGSSGYVLKPAFLIDSRSKPDAPQSWTFKILGAFHLPKLSRGKVPMNPYVKLSVYAGSPTETRLLFVTKTAKSNGFNPIWSAKDNFSFTVEEPSIAMLSFSVWDKSDGPIDEFIGASSLPISCLREGYRSVPLFDASHARDGSYAFPCLFVRAMKK